MRQPAITIVLLVFLASASPAQGGLQAKLRHLKIGKTNLSQIKTLFGEPDAVKEITSWVRGESTSKGVEYYIQGSQLARNQKDAPIRKLSTYSFNKLGLTFYVFDNPFELHSVEITNRRLWSNGIRVGSSLATVEKILGQNGDWWSSASSEDWNLEFNRIGVRFTFDRSPKLPKYPMRLKQKAVVTAIEVFDKRVHFL